MIRHFQHHFLSYSGFSLSTRLAPYIWRKPDGAMGSSALIAMNREIRFRFQEALDIAGDIAARPRPSFTRGIGSTLDVVGMGDNRIGHGWMEARGRPPEYTD